MRCCWSVSCLSKGARISDGVAYVGDAQRHRFARCQNRHRSRFSPDSDQLWRRVSGRAVQFGNGLENSYDLLGAILCSDLCERRGNEKLESLTSGTADELLTVHIEYSADHLAIIRSPTLGCRVHHVDLEYGGIVFVTHERLKALEA